MKMHPYLYISLLFFALFSCRQPHYEIVSEEGYTVPMDISQRETTDTSFINEVNLYKQKVDSITGQVIGKSAVFMDIKRPQSRLSNFTADLLKRKVGELNHTSCDFAIMNMGGIRTSLSKGDITVGEIFSIFPFDNSLSLLKIKGKDVKTLFESIASRKGEGISKEVALVVTPDYQIKSLRIGGKPIEEDRIYTVGTIDYLANGNDGMDAFKNAVERIDSHIRLRDVMLSYVKELQKEGKVLNATLDNRFIIE
ncbi:5'-nucleotidase C-terminal domain-containing protein [Coprobacter tertius]|uniref:5'-nucleotidase C-terminal domain-containing protein n=1 Tax=Coprobacter tertius TaxID=2944915 RepID=A0ABT1MGC6_9BACT|nr:5'-nucleotidase C-terminal domain-containing protein [Coprobacter tertius]MCP9610733.1 5'-nucleotidase C-terminal domain-containing protein [Coprobacter tertius]